MKKLAIVTHDQANEFTVRCRVEELGALLTPLTLRDPVPDGEFDGVLIDWDSLDTERRESLLASLLADSPRKLGLNSYNLNQEEARVLCRKGVVIFERLVPDALEWLVDDIR